MSQENVITDQIPSHFTHSESMSCTLHRSLVRPILLAGADRRLVLLNMTCIVLLIFGVGLHWATLISSLVLAIAGHTLLTRLAKSDPEFSDVYLRHIKYRDFYSAQSSVLAPSGRPL